MEKPNKSIQKRIKVTKTGKLVRRKAGINHFNAKQSRRAQRRQKEGVLVSGTYGKLLRRYINI